MSKNVIKKINLDFSRKTQPITVFAKQGDAESRAIIIQPMDNGVPFLGTELTNWHFFCLKPDGKKVNNTNVTAREDGTLWVFLSDQTLIAAGLGCCSVAGENSDGKKLTSQNFLLDIEYSAGAFANMDSTDEGGFFTDLEDQINDLKQEVEKLKPSTFYTVRVPAAGATDLYGWTEAQSGYELYIPDVEWMTENLFVELKSENAALFTEHNIVLNQDNGFLDFSIDSLPEKESILYIYIPSVVDNGLLNGGDA